jgi:Nif-specific regulatory protein
VSDGPETLESVRAERDLYARLLALGGHSDAGPFLDEALALVTETVGARSGYLALGDEGAARPVLAMTRGIDAQEVSSIRERMSRGIIGESLRTGQTVATASAMEDPRFAGNASVRAGRIDAVLCAPIGGDARLGVLYLQGRDRPGPFGARERALAELFARQVAPTAHRMLLQAREDAAREDPTAPWRARLKLGSIAGRSRAMAELFQRLAAAAMVDVTVLLTGESGTGKTELARALHASSPRASGPFVALNCAAIPEALFESELFGADKGAHSTATRRIAGKVEAAAGGTLFLDEVAELPATAQAKLLQFLQSRTFFRLGATEEVTADVRLVAATNADLGELVKGRQFREDLYYRLEVFPLRVPSLRERVEDVEPLCEHLLGGMSRATGRPLGLTWAARVALTRAEWPGNVRQLASALQRAAAFAVSEGRDAIDVEHLFGAGTPKVASRTPEGPPSNEEIPPWEEATRRFHRDLLTRTLEATRWNVTDASRRLGLARSHLYELLRAHGLSRSRP